MIRQEVKTEIRSPRSGMHRTANVPAGLVIPTPHTYEQRSMYLLTNLIKAGIRDEEFHKKVLEQHEICNKQVPDFNNFCKLLIGIAPEYGSQLMEIIRLNFASRVNTPGIYPSQDHHDEGMTLFTGGYGAFFDSYVVEA